jgi:ribonucleotide reductase alpha subunit
MDSIWGSIPEMTDSTVHAVSGATDNPSGVKVARRFTKPGEDPFASFTFVRRDARIVHPDGSVVFEMRDVEVPQEWGQTAIDVLASKYFRKAGVPQFTESGAAAVDDAGVPVLGPERSARQWASRIANAWLIWGVRGGYFASSEDAEAFRDEAAYILMAQIASPNSPQHFNTGLFESYGIVNDPNGEWYVDPATGEVKESAHRYERVSASACFPADTLVDTRSGRLPIEKIQPGDEVLTHEGRWREVTATMQRPHVEPLVRIQLEKMSATPLKATAEHPFLAVPAEQIHRHRHHQTADLTPRWINAGDLRPGDFVVVADFPLEGRIPPPVDLADHINDVRYFRAQPDCITSVNAGRDFHRFVRFTDPSIMRLIGRWLGDGSTSRQSNDAATLAGIRFTFNAAEHAAVDDVAELMARHFGLSSRREDAVGQQTTHLRFGCRPLAEWFVSEFGSGFAGKSLPAWVFELPQKHIEELLIGLWGSDGCLLRHEGKVSAFLFDRSNSDLSHGVWRLLRTLGCAPSLNGGRLQPGGTQPRFRISVHADTASFLWPEAKLAADDVLVHRLRIGSLRVDGAMTYRVRSVESEEFDGTVFNFSVADDESYTVEGVVVHNCYIQAIKDQLVGEGSIFDLMEREARLFQGGSGSGTNFSPIRGKGEKLSGGGSSSGAMSFIKVSDRAAGGIKSGGTTRRAAKMVLLDADHPEIEEFVWAKAHEERKIAALAAAGWDSAWNAEDGAVEAAFYQNFNASVMLPEGFMEAVEADADWPLIARMTGEPVRMMKARELWVAIAEAAWQCADPGVMFSDIINDWNTVRDADGEIVATNPCFTGDTLVHTDKGLVRFDELLSRTAAGESFGIYTHDATNPADPTDAVVLSTHDHVAVTGTNEIVKLTFDNGMEVRCTPAHRIWTSNRGYVQADELTADDQVLSLAHETPASAASWALPVSTDVESYMTDDELARQSRLTLPEKWSVEFAHYLGWLVAGGELFSQHAVISYGAGDDTALEQHARFLSGVLGHPVDADDQGDGSRQLRVESAPWARLLETLGVAPVGASHPRLPEALFQVPSEVAAAFLQGLFDATGSVSDPADMSCHVSLASLPHDLLVDVQRLLATFGVSSRISQDLHIAGLALARFAARVGFTQSEQVALLAQAVELAGDRPVDETVRLTSREFDGIEVTYNLAEPRNHSYIANGVVVRNCAEYVHVNDTSCNLASINLVKFWDDATRTFDDETFEHVVRLFTVMLEITVSMSHYPSKEVAFNSFEHRTLGLGYANLGALLMRAGLSYDSDEGRAAMSAITALLHLRAYTTSTELATAVGPCLAYERNRGSANRVIRNHVRAAHGDRLRPGTLEHAALGDYEGLHVRPVGLHHNDLANTPFASLSGPLLSVGDELVGHIDDRGLRNVFVSCIAPTGTIGLQLSCDTTGVEPSFALVIGKKLAGGGYMKIVNESVEPALVGLGYTPGEVEAIVAYALGSGTLDGQTPVNRASLLAAGLPAAAIGRLEGALASAFDLTFAADPSVVGGEHLLAAGISQDEWEAPGFSLLPRLGFSPADIETSSKVICGHQTVEGAPFLHDEHLAVFDCAQYCGDGTRTIHWSGHVRALGAVAPFVSGSTSKTVNLPNDATVGDVEDAHRMAYSLGVKNIAIYRDGSKGSQVLSSGSLKDTASDRDAELVAEVAADVDAIVAAAVAEALRATREIEAGVSPSQFYHDTTPPRFKLPSMVWGPEWRLNIGGQKLFLRASEYPDGTLGEIWIEVSKEGSLTKGLASCLSISVSQGLQHGVPLEKFVDTFTFHSFAPNGIVQGHDHVKMANSLVDLVFRVLGHHYLGREDLVQVKGPARRVAAPSGSTADRAASGQTNAPQPMSSATAVDRNEPGPPCVECGNVTVRSGACYRCLSCGASSGCS